MNKKLIVCAASVLGFFSMATEAHRAWMLPSETVVAGENNWVTFDLAVSNDIFHIDHAPMRNAVINILAPNGNVEEPKNFTTGQLRSTFDLQLTQSGTYKLFIASGGLNARWETADGKRAYWPERGAKPDLEEFKKVVPKKAKDLEISQSSRRVETFVTNGAPTIEAFKPTNVGLEMVPVTHPNDLVVSQPSEFTFLIDGKPAQGVEITIIEGGTRYRNSPAEIQIKTDQKGSALINWKKPGIYWLGASYRDEKAKKPAKVRTGNYSATLEVLPE